MAALALAPLLLALALLLLRQSAWVAATAGVIAAGLVALLAFPTAWSTLRSSALDYFPLILEVALILLFGMILARLLEASGAMQAISARVETLAPSRPLGVALVVFGIVPFAESVTGFGIGVTIGVPILVHLGCTLRQSALLGLLGLNAVPWGALGPGTTVAAALAGLDVDALGLTTAWINLIPVLVVTATVLLLTRPRLGGLLGTVAAAGLLWGGILGANAVVGMAPAGIIGSLIVIAVMGLVFAVRTRSGGLDASLRGALLPYAVLTLGLLAARAVADALPSTLTHLTASPPVWLAVACAVAALRVDGSHAIALAATRSWVPIGTATAAFMLLGWIMTTTDMSTSIGALLPTGLILLTPWLTTAGSILTGSNTGANSMFTGTLDAAAAAAGVSTMGIVAAGNAAGSLAALAAPPRVVMAVQLADADNPASRRDIAWVQSRALIISAVSTLAIGLWIQVTL